jgi:acyl carrier protein
MKSILEILTEIRPEFDFSKKSDFIEEGMLDSFDLVVLVSSLEDNYSIKIDGIDIVPENFGSLKAIEATLKKNGAKY